MALASFPAIHSQPVLPAQSGRLIGRAQEVRALRARLLRPDVRLVTVVGPPGCGKTRLAIEVASGLIGRFADGARLVELSSVADPAHVVSAIALALGVGEFGGQAPRDALFEALRERRLLLVLDNLEHLLAPAKSG